MKFWILLFYLLVISSFSAFSQIDQSDYIIRNHNDTIPCIAVKAKRFNGNITHITYTDLEGESYSIKGKKKCEEITTYSESGQIFDLIPLKASKPNGYMRHMWRKVDGKIKIYDYLNVMSSTPNMNYSMNSIMNSPVTVERYVVKLDNGKFFNIKRRNIKTTIMPYLLECQKFKEKFKSDELNNPAKFEALVKSYNEICEGS